MRWVSVAERLPHADVPVLIWGNGFIDIGWYDEEDERWYAKFFACEKYGTVTHWMSLPGPPKEE